MIIFTHIQSVTLHLVNRNNPPSVQRRHESGDDVTVPPCVGFLTTAVEDLYSEATPVLGIAGLDLDPT